MKIKKNVLLLSLIFLGILPSGYGIEPWRVINGCIGLASQSRVAGNVLAYKNKFNQTIILASGERFSDDISNIVVRVEEREEVAEERQQYIIIPIEDIVGLTTNTEMLCSNDYQLNDTENQILKQPGQPMNNFLTVCERENVVWTRAVARPIFTLNLHGLLQYRHTEIQVQALYNTYINEPAGLRKNKLEALLPAILVPGVARIDRNIYSLFEACHACEKTVWLARDVAKNNFYFRVLDSQYTFSGKYKVADVYQEMGAQVGFMSQRFLENIGGGFKNVVQGDLNQQKINGIKSAFILPNNGEGFPRPYNDAIRRQFTEQLSVNFQKL